MPLPDNTIHTPVSAWVGSPTHHSRRDHGRIHGSLLPLRFMFSPADTPIGVLVKPERRTPPDRPHFLIGSESLSL